MPSPLRPSALTAGFTWASRITTLGLTFALPPLVGYAVDRMTGLSPWGTLLGAILGMGVGMFRVLEIARRSTADIRRNNASKPHRPRDTR